MHKWLVRPDREAVKGCHRVKGFDRLAARLDALNAILPQIGHFKPFLPGLPRFRQNDFAQRFCLNRRRRSPQSGLHLATYEQNQTKACQG